MLLLCPHSYFSSQNNGPSKTSCILTSSFFALQSYGLLPTASPSSSDRHPFSFLAILFNCWHYISLCKRAPLRVSFTDNGIRVCRVASCIRFQSQWFPFFCRFESGAHLGENGGDGEKIWQGICNGGIPVDLWVCAERDTTFLFSVLDLHSQFHISWACFRRQTNALSYSLQYY